MSGDSQKSQHNEFLASSYSPCDMLITENSWTYFGEIPRALLATLLPGGWNMSFPIGGSTGYRSMEHGLLALKANRPPEVTRTMVGLRNLQVFRGEFQAPKFDLQKMMVGPCHFYGTLPSDIGVTSYKLVLPTGACGGVSPKPEIAAIRGCSMTYTQHLLLKQQHASSEKPPPQTTVSLTGTFSDTFQPSTTLTAGYNNTGVFKVEEWNSTSGAECYFETGDATEYDLQRFGAQVVKNGDEFAIPGILCDQDDLQLITYWWGEDYLDHCITHDDGAFLETHDFPQTITPLSQDCGGHLLLARPVSNFSSTTMEVLAVHIPYGYTIVLGKNCWHGDMGLKGMHLMAMTANHLIMEGTTKSWFLRDGMDNYTIRSSVDSSVQDKQALACQPENLKNLTYRVDYGVGAREHQQPCESSRACVSGCHGCMKIPSELQSLVSCSGFPCVQHGEKVRHEHWSMLTDEVIRKYAPWSSPSSERVAVAAKDARLFQKRSTRPEGVVGADNDDVYVKHQHDLAHRFDHGAVQLYDACRETVGPLSPFWMLRAPRSGQWGYVIGRVVARTLAGTVSFTIRDVWSDSTVGDLLSAVSGNTTFCVVSQGMHAEVLEMSEVLLNHYPDPEIAQDGVSELTITVVGQQREKQQVPFEHMRRERPTFSFFFGLISIQK